MLSRLTAKNAALGLDPLRHMAFLVRAPERLLALRLALSRTITDTSVVFDAGCGSLGLLAIMAAKLGARRVVGVDVGPLDVARKLASENGVADRVHFVQSDLHDLELPDARFNVIVAMIYNNEIRRDLAQQRLVAQLVHRFGTEDAVVIPNRVRYVVSGYGRARSDDDTRRLEWITHIENVERQAGLGFDAVRALLDHPVPPLLKGARRHRLATLAQSMLRRWRSAERNPLNHYSRTQMQALTKPAVFTEIAYAAGTDISYPESVSLEATNSGFLSKVIWQQDLLFDNLLIRSTESIAETDSTDRVEPGDVVVLDTSGEWERLRVGIQAAERRL